jgi:histidyl-tRNA synthetase
MSIKAQTLKGFRDFLPEQANAREFVVGKIKETFRLFGFEPLETPALEYEEVLAGKYGEEGEKLMYRFTDNGDRRVALRYDQTVPLARVIAQYPEIPKPFKRYQVQNVWRAENTQKGRYREFLQCDIDTVGSESTVADAEIIACAVAAAKRLGLAVRVKINDRSIFDQLGLNKSEIIAIDKLNKIGEDGVIAELQEFKTADPGKLLTTLKSSGKTDRLDQLFSFLESFNLKENTDFIFDPTLARGLDYYTSVIFEMEVEGTNLSIGGGGRYDNLIGQYSGQNQPAVGFSFGFDRTMEVLQEKGLLKENSSSAKVLVTTFSIELGQESIEATAKLRSSGINTDMWLDANAKLDKQLKYADAKGIPYVVIIGPDEAKNGTVTLKNLSEKTQETLSLDEVVSKLG